MATEFEGWTHKELLEEIRREEEIIFTRQRDLAILQKRRREIETTFTEEQLPKIEQRHPARAERIQALEASQLEWQIQIDRFQNRINRRELEINNLKETIRRLEARLPYLSATERYITRGTIRILTRSLTSLEGWQTRDQTFLTTLKDAQRSERRRLGAFKAWQTREEPLLTRLAELKDALATTNAQIVSIKAEIAKEQERLETKRKLLPPARLYRIKIRLYTEERKPTPTGMFQAFFEIDARLDLDTGLVDWNWDFTKDEIEIAKFHMLGYFKGAYKWRTPEQVDLAYFFEKEIAEKGIPAKERRVAYKEPYETYAPRIPTEFIEKAERLTVKDLILGESSVVPKPVVDLEKELGVYFQQVFIIDSEGTIKWHEKTGYYVYKPSAERIKKIKDELGIE